MEHEKFEPSEIYFNPKGITFSPMLKLNAHLNKYGEYGI